MAVEGGFLEGNLTNMFWELRVVEILSKWVTIGWRAGQYITSISFARDKSVLCSLVLEHTFATESRDARKGWFSQNHCWKEWFSIIGKFRAVLIKSSRCQVVVVSKQVDMEPSPGLIKACVQEGLRPNKASPKVPIVLVPSIGSGPSSTSGAVVPRCHLN